MKKTRDYNKPIPPGKTRCFACGQIIPYEKSRYATTTDNQIVSVGSNCYQQIRKTAENGYQPLLGGPRLYLLNQSE